MKFSVIIPSYNQERFIGNTLENVVKLKSDAAEKGIDIEIILIDSESNAEVQKIISLFRKDLDHIDISKDKGQYDAINKGLKICSGDYWTWLNTDDHIDINGFFKLVEILKKEPDIDYIYGGIQYMDTDNNLIKDVKAKIFTLDSLVNVDPGIYQPGSFFKTSFTRTVGDISSYRCCFDYEYILRCLKKDAKIYVCDFPLSRFRYYSDSKTGSMIPVFIREQLLISKDFGRKPYSKLTWFSNLRLLKHRLFPRQ